MKDPSEEITVSDKSNLIASVSERKLKANQENAVRSTGPRTTRGKEFSRRNALKHGLLVNSITDFEALSEDPLEFEALLNGLLEQYRPVGKAEEIEVERIAICYWKLKRSWRYENATNLAACRDFIRPELRGQAEYCEQKTKEEDAVIGQLQIARNEINNSGRVSPELKERIFGMMPQLSGAWSALEKAAVEVIDGARLFRRCSARTRTKARDIYVVTYIIRSLEVLTNRRWSNVTEVAIGRHAIPDEIELDRILRYEAAVNRDLGRSFDRLECLQRRRNGEPLLPPVNVRVSR